MTQDKYRVVPLTHRQRDSTWIAARTPKGELEPLTELSRKEMICLAVEAGLMGVDLATWLRSVIKVQLLKDQRKRAPAGVTRGGYWLELAFPPEEWDLLRDCFLTDEHSAGLDFFVSCLLVFLAEPGRALEAERWAAKCSNPDQLAGRLLAGAYRQCGMLSHKMDAKREADEQRFTQRLQAGRYHEALKRVAWE